MKGVTTGWNERVLAISIYPSLHLAKASPTRSWGGKASGTSRVQGGAIKPRSSEGQIRTAQPEPWTWTLESEEPPLLQSWVGWTWASGFCSKAQDLLLWEVDALIILPPQRPSCGVLWVGASPAPGAQQTQKPRGLHSTCRREESRVGRQGRFRTGYAEAGCSSLEGDFLIVIKPKSGDLRWAPHCRRHCAFQGEFNGCLTEGKPSLYAEWEKKS